MIEIRGCLFLMIVWRSSVFNDCLFEYLYQVQMLCFVMTYEEYDGLV